MTEPQITRVPVWGNEADLLCGADKLTDGGTLFGPVTKGWFVTLLSNNRRKYDAWNQIRFDNIGKQNYLMRVFDTAKLSDKQRLRYSF